LFRIKNPRGFSDHDAAWPGRRLHDRRPVQGGGYTTAALKVAVVTKPPPCSGRR
ncbi:hypothetical protein KI387_012000, partial [Taxus chinensis]